MTQSQTPPGVSIVIPTHNGSGKIRACLEAIRRQTSSVPVEVIVVTDRCTDDTALIAASLGATVLDNTGPQGPGAARNTGLAAARYPFVAFTDDDCRPGPDWLEQLLRTQAESGAAAVGGRTVPSDADHLLCRYLAANEQFAPLEVARKGRRSHARRLIDYLRRTWGAATVPDSAHAVAATGAGNLLMETAVLRDLGGFDTAYEFSGEDFDLCRRLNDSLPDRLWFCPSAIALHEFEPSITASLRRAHLYAVGNVKLRRRHPDVGAVLFPFPVAWAAATVLLLLAQAWPWLVVPTLLVPVAYARYLTMAVTRRSAEPLLYAYLQFAQETAGNIGLLTGQLRIDRAGATRRRGPAS